MQGPCNVPLLGVTIGQWMQQRVEEHPDKVAAVFRHQNKRLSFQELLEQVKQLISVKMIEVQIPTKHFSKELFSHD